MYFEQHSGEIYAAVTNMTMPHLSGPDLAENLRRIKPDICLILVTGYGEDHVDKVPSEKLNLYHRVLFKPFVREQLLDAIETGCA